MLKPSAQKLRGLLLAGDLGLTALAWVAAYGVRYTFLPLAHDAVPLHWHVGELPFVLFFAALSYRLCGLYEVPRLQRFPQEFATVVKAGGLLFLLLITTSFYRREFYQSRAALGLFLALNVFGLALARRAVWALLRSLRKLGYNQRRALIIGSGRAAQKVAKTLKNNPWTGLAPVGYVDDDTDRSPNGLPILGRIDDLPMLIDRHGASFVFIALPLVRYEDVRRAMSLLSRSVVEVQMVPDLPSLAGLSLSTTEIDGLAFVGLRGSPQHGWSYVVKRSIDVVVSVAALGILSPVMLIIAALVRLTSRGPVLYRQERASLAGQPFLMLKFRTMHVDAEQETGPVWARPGDERRTRLGSFLRRTSLDELPQLFNVLKGDMSLVGPRPERPVFIRKFRQTIPNYMLRHSVKAGITGWAQIHGWRGDTSLRKRVQYDLYYITHWSVWLDLRILSLTLFRGLANKNAY